MMPRQRHVAGFSLIEVLVALVILGVGLMGLARLQLFLLAGTADTVAYDQAIRLANEQVETLRFSRLAGNVPTPGADEPVLHGMTFQRLWTVACSTDQSCQTKVIVSWTEPRDDGQQGRRELMLNAWLAAPTSVAQGWLVQSGPPMREILP